MTRFERFGFLRVLVVGAFVLLIIALHGVLLLLEVVAVGAGCLFAWRWLGDELRKRRERGDRVRF